MNVHEIQRSLRALRLSGMAEVLDVRIVEAQSEDMAPIDFLAGLVQDELTRRADRLVERRRKQARFRDPDRTLDAFDFGFNPKMNKKLIFELATCRFIDQMQDVLFLGQPGTGKSHLAQALGMNAILKGYRVAYREAHILLEELADATLEGRRRDYLKELNRARLLIIDDLGMRKLPRNAAEELLEIVMRRYERSSTLLTSNRPVEDWQNMLGDTATVGAMLDRLLHHGHVVKCGPKSWRTSRRKSLPKPEAKN